MVTPTENYTEEVVRAWWEQILFWRTHLDVFIVDVLKIKLKDDQRVIARAIGNGTVSNIVAARGLGPSRQRSHGWLLRFA